jgi:hypothetical protein
MIRIRVTFVGTPSSYREFNFDLEYLLTLANKVGFHKIKNVEEFNEVRWKITYLDGNTAITRVFVGSNIDLVKQIYELEKYEIVEIKKLYVEPT